MPLGLTQSGYYSGMDKSLDERLRDNKIRQQAAAQGKSVKDFLEDREYYKEIADIDSEKKADEAEDAAAEETAANDAAFAERPWRDLRETRTGKMPEPDPDFLNNEFFQGNRTIEDSMRFGEKAEEGAVGYEKMYPESYKDSVRKDETYGNTREREIYVDSPLDKMKKLQWELGNKVSKGEMTKAEAEEAFENSRQGLFREINLEKAGAFSGEFQGVGVMPEKPATEPRITGYVEEPEVEALEAASEKEGLIPVKETVEEEQVDIGRDDEKTEVKQVKEAQKKAAGGDSNAVKARKEMFEGMPKEEKAMAKEELGNYYIGPGGFAIDLDEVSNSLSREGDFKLLQQLPDHAKPYMLMKMGYINKEDYEGMPESSEFRTEEMKLVNNLDLGEQETERKRMGVEGSKDVETIRTEAQKIMAKGKYANNIELQTMQDHASQTALKMNLDWQALKQSSVEMIAMDDRELRRHVADMQNVTANKEIDEHTNRLVKQISSNESIAKWGIDAKKVLQTDAGVLQKELAEMGHNVTREEIQATQDRLNTQLASDKTLKKMGIDGSLLIAGDKNELERYRIETATDVDLEKIHMLRDHFKQEMTFKGKELDTNMAFKGASLAQMGATELMKHERLSKQGQRDWLVKQHTMNQQAIKQMFDNGQVEAAMMIQARNGVSTPPNLVNFWRLRGKRLKGTVATQQAVTSHYEGMTFDDVNEGYLKELNGMYKGLLKTKRDPDTGYTALEQSVVTAGGKPWSEMSEGERAEQVDSKGEPILSYAHWEAVKIQEAIDTTFNNPNSMYGPFHQAMKFDETKAQLDANKKKKKKEKGKTGGAGEASEEVLPVVSVEAAEEEGAGGTQDDIVGGRKPGDSELPLRATPDDRRREKREQSIVRSNKNNLNNWTKKYKNAVKDLKIADASGKYTQDSMAGDSTLKQKYKRYKNAVEGFKKKMDDAGLSLRKQQAKLKKFIKDVKERK